MRRLTNQDTTLLTGSTRSPVVAPERDFQHMFTDEQIEAKKQQDRYFYKLSKMKVAIDHVEFIKNKEGKLQRFNPVDRIEIDLKHIKQMTSEIIAAYKRKVG